MYLIINHIRVKIILQNFPELKAEHHTSELERTLKIKHKIDFMPK